MNFEYSDRTKELRARHMAQGVLDRAIQAARLGLRKQAGTEKP